MLKIHPSQRASRRAGRRRGYALLRPHLLLGKACHLLIKKLNISALHFSLLTLRPVTLCLKLSVVVHGLDRGHAEDPDRPVALPLTLDLDQGPSGRNEDPVVLPYPLHHNHGPTVPVLVPRNNVNIEK